MLATADETKLKEVALQRVEHALRTRHLEFYSRTPRSDSFTASAAIRASANGC